MELLENEPYTSFLNGSKSRHRSRHLWRRAFRNGRIKAFASIAIACFFLLLVSSVFVFYWSKPDVLEDDGLINPKTMENNYNSTFESENLKGEEDLWSEELFSDEFARFKVRYQRSYPPHEELSRYEIFKQNLKFIHSHNREGHSYTLKMNQFGDLTNGEFRKAYLGFDKQRFMKASETAMEIFDMPDKLPVVVDWKSKNCVTNVKDQGPCGSCWSFSATGALESAYCVKTGVLINLSEQQLLDCSSEEGNNGCNGGQMEFAFMYVMKHKGLCTENDYPYQAKVGNCLSTNCTSLITIKGYKEIPRYNEFAMKAALYKYGPVSVALDASSQAFQFYSEGIFDGDCGTEINHAALLVAYMDTSFKNSSDYFQIKNSWGVNWGEGGYMRMAMHRGPMGLCGILMEASLPII